MCNQKLTYDDLVDNVVDALIVSESYVGKSKKLLANLEFTGARIITTFSVLVNSEKDYVTTCIYQAIDRYNEINLME